MERSDHLPLTEATFFILLSLAPAPKHGYAILKEVEALSNGRLLLSTGTLYGAIRRMLDSEWIERVEQSSAAETGHERKAYALTPYGRQILNSEIDRLHTLVQTARAYALPGDQ